MRRECPEECLQAAQRAHALARTGYDPVRKQPGQFEIAGMPLIGLALLILSVYAMQAGAHLKSGGVE